MTWHMANSATSMSIRRRISMRDTSIMSGSDSSITTHAYTDMSMPVLAVLMPKSAPMSLRSPIGTNSDVLKTKAEHASPTTGSQLRRGIFLVLSIQKAIMS